MISYAKHEEEFYGVLKLVNGEEILGKAVLTDDSGESLCFIQNPVAVQMVEREVVDHKMARGIGFSKWMQLSDEDFFVIREKDILTISAMSKECIFMYESYLKGETFDTRKEKMEENPNKHLGYLGSIESARKLCEKIFKEL
tara:strand:- start:81 stop:506 length:426 start_codon:yes stop_codon:yes gene_type:complete